MQVLLYFTGECKLENMRTLCVVCHARVTKEQCAERRSTRLKAKKQLKELMNDLRNVQNLKQNYSEEKVCIILFFFLTCHAQLARIYGGVKVCNNLVCTRCMSCILVSVQVSREYLESWICLQVHTYSSRSHRKF